MFILLDRLLGALIDPLRRERVVLATLAVYAVLWTSYGIIARSGLDFHFDMVEQIAWSRDLALGYFKHPPLAAVLVRLWFDIFPIANWSYYFMAILVAVTALWIIWQLMGDYLDAEKRVVGLALLTLIPFFNFHALKYNVNTILMPLWAATTFLFLRSFRTHSLVYSALAGIGGAACMLGKYWSIFLIVGLIAGALFDRRRAAYFRSAAPWVTIGAGLAVLIPHLVWLVQNHFAPFSYALAEHGYLPASAVKKSVAHYIFGAAAYAAVPVTLAFIAIRPSYATFIDMVRPKSDDRRLESIIFWVPLLSPIIVALVVGTELHALWSMSLWALFPQILLSSPSVKISRTDARNILAIAVALPFVSLMAAPVVPIFIDRSDIVSSAEHTQLLAARVERAWAETTDQPLRLVSGDPHLAYGVATYAHDRPAALPGLPPKDEAELSRYGVAFVCYAKDERCNDTAVRALTKLSGHRVDVEIVRKHLGYDGRPRKYVIVVVPPQS